jgi:hypothetical protein
MELIDAFMFWTSIYGAQVNGALIAGFGYWLTKRGAIAFAKKYILSNTD